MRWDLVMMLCVCFQDLLRKVQSMFGSCLVSLYIKHKLESTWSRKSITYQLQVGHVPLISAQSQTILPTEKKREDAEKSVRLDVSCVYRSGAGFWPFPCHWAYFSLFCLSFDFCPKIYIDRLYCNQSAGLKLFHVWLCGIEWCDVMRCVAKRGY